MSKIKPTGRERDVTEYIEKQSEKLQKILVEWLQK
jgi:hypothetical protein